MAFNFTDPSTWDILIVDDEPDSIGVAAHVLTFYGAQVQTAESGQECLTILDEHIPDILLLDIQMPYLSGWEVVKQIRGNEHLKTTIVIALTAHAMFGDRDRALNAGFTGYLTKPISPLTFTKDIINILSGVLPP